MIVETALGLGVLGATQYLKSGIGSDKQKLDRLFRKAGLYVKYNGKEDTPRLLRSAKKETYTEYVYRIPEGLSSSDFIKKKQVIEDGLNSSKSIVHITLSDLKNIDFKGDIPKQIQTLTKPKTTLKEVHMEFKKVLTLRVYHSPLTGFLSYEEAPKTKNWEVPIGITRTEKLKHDFDKIMHMVVAGTTRYGKSIFLKNVITTLLINRPHDVSFTLIDLKGGLTFGRYRNCPQVNPIASDAFESLKVLQAINDQMDEVMVYLKKEGFENMLEAGINKRHFIIVDEGAELAPGIEKDPELKKIKNQCEVILSRVARIGGALGYRLIYATQTPYSEVLNHNIKQNCDAKLCFKLQTDKASEVVLGEGITDASRLPFIKGRGVYLTDRKHIVQTPMIENDYIEGVVNNVSKK